jgi:hypothetical protein
MNITTWVAVLFSVEIAGVVALEIIGQRRARRRALPNPKPVGPIFVIEDDDGRTRVFERPAALPRLGYFSSGLMNFKVRPANRSATR